MAKYTFEVQSDSAGHRLDRFLERQPIWVSRMRLNAAILAGGCLVNGAVAKRDSRLKASDVIEIEIDETVPSSMQPERLAIETVYDDEHIIVVDKPAGMLVHPTRGKKSGTLLNGLSFHLNRELLEGDVGREKRFIRPGLIHRLDRETSGLMVIAKTQQSLSVLTGHFHKRLARKTYLAVVDGDPGSDSDWVTIDAPIGRVEDGPPFWTVTRDGREALTRFRKRSSNGSHSLVELQPLTGRTNQLRIHCKHIGYPITGDLWHGGSEFSRLCLHASGLGFNHPATGEWVEFHSPAPSSFIGLLGCES
jgi:23S rRNA pseudouridine1911/1915/1917 synthase